MEDILEKHFYVTLRINTRAIILFKGICSNGRQSFLTNALLYVMILSVKSSVSHYTCLSSHRMETLH